MQQRAVLYQTTLKQERNKKSNLIIETEMGMRVGGETDRQAKRSETNDRSNELGLGLLCHVGR